MNIVKKYWKRVVAVLAIAFMIAALVIPGVVKNSLAEETSKNYYYYNGTVLLTTLHMEVLILSQYLPIHFHTTEVEQILSQLILITI